MVNISDKLRCQSYLHFLRHLDDYFPSQPPSLSLSKYICIYILNNSVFCLNKNIIIINFTIFIIIFLILLLLRSFNSFLFFTFFFFFFSFSCTLLAHETQTWTNILYFLLYIHRNLIISYPPLFFFSSAQSLIKTEDQIQITEAAIWAIR